MHILFLAQCYAPEEVSAAVLITELATGLARSGHTLTGHRVTVVTGAPSYPYGRVFDGYRNRLYQVEILDGVRVVRTWSYISPHKTFWRRLFHYGSYSLSAFYGSLLAGKPDVIVSFSPPLTLGLSAWALSRLWKIPWVLQLEDLYPEAALAAGVLRPGLAARFFDWMARFQYRRAAHISVIAESFRESLLARGIPAEGITVIPNWSDPDVVRPLPRENDFRRRYGAGRPFLALYAGNIGLTSSLEDVLQAAALLKDDPDIFFLIVGEGVKKPALEAFAREQGLPNVAFLPYQPRELLPEIMAAADISLATLNSDSALSSLPSKVFTIMASARPVLAIAPLQSELARLVAEAGCGIVVPPGQPQRLAESLQTYKSQLTNLQGMGSRGRIQLEREYSRVGCVSRYEQMLMKVEAAGEGEAG
jgi:colanic acid biosynthesis glycosyl transferase WcaI